MEATVKVGRILGIPVGLHWSWFLVFLLLTWSLTLGYFPQEYPNLTAATYLILGVITSLLLFVSVLIHELGHSIIALRNNIPVRGITLFIFGGVAQIGREPASPGVEFRIAIAGPLASLGLAGLFTALWALDRTIPYLAAPSLWLIRINLILTFFNLIPGFPLDGGRVLRAVVWQFTGSIYRATQIAAFSGQLIAFGFIGLGIFIMLGGNLYNGLWLAFIGWFLQNAAAASYNQANLQQSLRGVTAVQAMSRNFPLVSEQTLLADLVENRILTGEGRCFFVMAEGRLRGVVTLTDVSRVPKTEWGQTTASQVMTPWEHIIRVQPDTALLSVLQTMDDANINQVPVVEDEAIVGILSREQVLRYLRLRAELGL